MHDAGKEIACGRKVTYRLRRTFAPCAVGIVLRFHAHDAGNLYAVHTAMILGVQHRLVVVFNGTAPEALDGHLHIRLTCTDPHLSCKYIINRNLSVAIIEGDGQRLV